MNAPRHAWRFLNQSPPLLALALLVPLVLALFFVLGVDPAWVVLRRGAVQVGIAGYLLAMVGFVALGRRNQAWPVWHQIGVAAALGLAFTLVAQVYATHYRPAAPILRCIPAPADPRDASAQVFLCEAAGAKAKAPETSEKSPLDPINALAAVLAVALAVLTLVAQKSASEARTEAEKAQEMVLGRQVGMQMLAIWSRLALETQRLREGGREQMARYESYEASQPELANLHREWASLYGATVLLLIDLLHAVDAGEADALTQQCGRIRIMAAGLDTRHRNQTDAEAHDLLRDQGRRFVTPLRNLLRRAIDLLGETDVGQMSAEHRLELRETLRLLDASLRVLA